MGLRFAMMADLVRLWTLLLLVPLSADAYSRGAGSCHTASGGHGEAAPGDGGFALSLASAATAGSSTLTLRLAHTVTETQFKGFLVKVNGPASDDAVANVTSDALFVTMTSCPLGCRTTLGRAASPQAVPAATVARVAAAACC